VKPRHSSLARRSAKRLAAARPKTPEGQATLADIVKVEADLATRVREDAKTKAFEAPASAIIITTKSRAHMEREQSVLSRTLIEEERQLGRDSFWYFLTEILFPDIWKKHYTETLHKQMCDELQNLGWGEEFWAFLPRKRRKSYVITLAHGWWRIIRDPNIRILLVGAREETVKPFARVMRAAFIPGSPGFEKFQQLYSDFLFQDSNTHLRQAFQFTVPCRNKILADPTFRAAYLGVAGAGWRCDLCAFDDPVERRNVAHAEMSMKALMQIMDLYPLLDDTGPYNMTTGAATRWAFHDPFGYILGDVEGAEGNEDTLERLRNRRMKVMVRHALEDPNRSCEHCSPAIVAAYPHNHPTMQPDGISCDFPIHDWQSVQDDYQKYSKNPNLGESMFWHQLMNVCLSPKDQKFQKEWFPVADMVYWPLPKRRVVAIDSADKDFQKEGIGDWMVALFGEFDDYGRLLLVHGLRSNQWTRKEFQNRITAWCKASAWIPNIAVKEKFGDGQGSFLTDLERKFQEVGIYCHMMVASRGSSGGGSGGGGQTPKKLDWIVDCLQSPMEGYEVAFGRSFPEEIRKQAINELTQLGMTRYDDVADTMALFYVEGVRLMAAPKHGQTHVGWRPPSLDLYSAGISNAPPPVVTMTLIQQAMQGEAWKSVAEELPTLNTQKPEQPSPLQIKIDY
jgi:hypothetical protein